MNRHKGMAFLAAIGLVLTGCDDRNEIGWQILEKYDDTTILVYLFTISSYGEDKDFKIRVDVDDSNQIRSTKFYGKINCNNKSVKLQRFSMVEGHRDGSITTKSGLVADTDTIPFPFNKFEFKLYQKVCQT